MEAGFTEKIKALDEKVMGIALRIPWDGHPKSEDMADIYYEFKALMKEYGVKWEDAPNSYAKTIAQTYREKIAHLLDETTGKTVEMKCQQYLEELKMTLGY